MRCFTCRREFSRNETTTVDGLHFCHDCMTEQYMNLPTTNPKSDEHERKKSEDTRIDSNLPLKQPRSNNFLDHFRRYRSAAPRSFRKHPSLPSSDALRPSSNSDANAQIQCQVCFDEKSARYFQHLHKHPCRQNPRSICDECVYQHIQQSFQEMCNDTVSCPELTCQMKFEYETIKSILRTHKNMKLFERYDRFILHHQLEQMEDFIWCSNPRCQMGHLHEGGRDQNIVTCRRCHKKTCFIHKGPWHEGLSCAEFDAGTSTAESATIKWLKRNAKQCPKCPYQIEKNDGCDHMTCIKCRYEFCWVCLADFNRIRQDGNHRHHPECKHYAPYDGDK